MRSNHYGQELACWLAGFRVLCVLCGATGGRLAVAKLGVAHRVVSVRLEETGIPGQVRALAVPSRDYTVCVDSRKEESLTCRSLDG